MAKLIGFRQIMRTVRRPPAATEDLLALLVGWGIVEMVLGDRNFMYGLADEQALENLETKGRPCSTCPYCRRRLRSAD